MMGKMMGKTRPASRPPWGRKSHASSNLLAPAELGFGIAELHHAIQCHFFGGSVMLNVVSLARFTTHCRLSLLHERAQRCAPTLR